MKPIVNPIIFYLIQLANNISCFALIICVVSIVGIGFYKIFYPNTFVFRKRWLILPTIMLILVIFLPTQETCEKMLVAHYCTRENINEVLNFVDEIQEKLTTNNSE